MFDVQFIEALAYALARKVVPSDEYYQDMTAIQRQQAVSIAGMAQIDQISSVIDKVNKAIADGTTMADFIKSVESGEVDLGLSTARLDNIFRTNVMGAYNRGKWYQQQANKNARPYLMYDAVNDSRTRPTHLALDGTIRPVDDPFWQTHSPPCGYRCRCTTRSLTEKQAQKMGITANHDLPSEQADDGFGLSPKFYTENFNRMVKDKISELMLKEIGQATETAKIAQRIQASITASVTAKVEPLQNLLAKAIVGAGNTVVTSVNLSEIIPPKDRVQTLALDPATGENSVGEAKAMASLEVHYNSQARRFTKQEVIEAGSKKIGDFVFITGAMQHTKLDLMFTTDDLSKQSIDLQNQWFTDKKGNLSKQIKASIQKHLEKDVEIIPLDLRVLSDQNQALLIAYIESLAYNDKQRFIFLTNGDTQ